MIGAKVVLVDKTSGVQLPDPVTTIASPVPSGSLRIRLPEAVKPGAYYLKALNGHGEQALKVSLFMSAKHPILSRFRGFIRRNCE